MPEHRRCGEPGQVGDRDVVRRRADRIGGRHPAGAEHDRDVVSLDAGEFGQPSGGQRRSLDRRGGTHASPAWSSSSPVSSSRRAVSSSEVSPTDWHGRSRNSFT